MSRTEGDTWEITESVGSTALGVAGGRAAETLSDDPLISDPFAQMFLDAVGNHFSNLHAHERDLPPEVLEIDPRMGERMRAMRGYVACRTLFFDDFFLDAATEGITQAVILAAGLDARAWRLDWPAGCVVYELDQPKVLDFKAATLESHDVAPRTQCVAVAVDLRDDWPRALRAAGFDPALPTAWSAEGLLPYLPAEAQDLLFERVLDLSAPGSRVAVEAFADDFYSTESRAKREEQTQRYRVVAARMGRNEPTSMSNLFYEEERAAVKEWFADRGWNAEEVSALDLMAHNGRRPPDDLDDATLQTTFVTARLP
jgi:methyltransferase (TIGR00027 family)